MRNIILPIITVAFMSYSCFTQERKFEVEVQIENWTKELIQNNKISNCDEENQALNYYLKDLISSESDFNKDGIKDGLFYYKYNSCGGTLSTSDMAMFIYSENGQLITDKNFTQAIEKKIENELTEMKISKIERISIEFKGLGQSIVGSYTVWIEGDSNGWPSIHGSFEYDLRWPFFEININKK